VRIETKELKPELCGQGDQMGRHHATLGSLAEATRVLNEEYSALRRQKSKQRLMQPATKAQVAKVEQAICTRLPADYGEFLQLHNGWENFYADYSLLSTKHLTTGGALAKRLAQLKDLLGENPKSAQHKPLIILAGPFGKLAVYFDQSARMELVEWDPGGEIERHKNFVAYLRASKARLEDVIKMERKRLR
jgi:hypothetical protein